MPTKNDLIEVLRRYDPIIGEIPEAEEIYNAAILALEQEHGLSDTEIDALIAFQVIKDPEFAAIHERLFVTNPPLTEDSVLEHIGDVLGNETVNALKNLAKR